jgi:PAS domain-containing protein
VGASILSNEYKLTIDDIRKRIFGEANADEPNSQFLIMLSFSIMLMSAVDCLLTRSAAYATVFILSATIYFNTRKRYKQYDFMNKPWFTTLLSYATTTLLLFAGNSFSGNLQKYYFLSMISTLLISENIVQFVTSAILYALFSSILQFGILEGISLFCIVVPAIVPLSMTYFDLREELDQSDVSIDYYKGLSLLSSEALIIHKDGNVLNVNSAFLTLFGYEGDKEKILHTDVSKFFTSETPYQYLNAEVDSAPDLNYEDEASPKRIIFECIGKRKDNSIIPLEIIGTVQDFLGQKVVVLGIRDICSRQAKETVLEDQEEQSAKSRFLTIVSHE